MFQIKWSKDYCKQDKNRDLLRTLSAQSEFILKFMGNK